MPDYKRVAAGTLAARDLCDAELRPYNRAYRLPRRWNVAPAGHLPETF